MNLNARCSRPSICQKTAPLIVAHRLATVKRLTALSCSKLAELPLLTYDTLSLRSSSYARLARLYSPMVWQPDNFTLGGRLCGGWYDRAARSSTAFTHPPYPTPNNRSITRWRFS
jgi:hypothetical protein